MTPRPGAPRLSRRLPIINYPSLITWHPRSADNKGYAGPPTGSISYINYSTSSIHPVASGVEIRKEGRLGRVYYPQPHLTNENAHLFQSASTIGYKKVIDTYAVSQHWVDQGQSLTLFFTDKATTRDINLAQIRAWRMGCKSLYYIRIQQPAMGGTVVEGTAAGFCESCAL